MLKQLSMPVSDQYGLVSLNTLPASAFCSRLAPTSGALTCSLLSALAPQHAQHHHHNTVCTSAPGPSPDPAWEKLLYSDSFIQLIPFESIHLNRGNAHDSFTGLMS